MEKNAFNNNLYLSLWYLWYRAISVCDRSAGTSCDDEKEKKKSYNNGAKRISKTRRKYGSASNYPTQPAAVRPFGLGNYIAMRQSRAPDGTN